MQNTEEALRPETKSGLRLRSLAEKRSRDFVSFGRVGQVTDQATSPAAPRRDSVRNRALLIDAAKAAFAADGLSASVNRIADDAGVNVATLYRHFPAKDHLIDAVLESIVEPLGEVAESAAASDAPIASFLRGALQLQTEHRGLVDALSREAAGPQIRNRLRIQATELVSPVTDAGHRSGELDADYGTSDLLVTLRMLSALTSSTAVEASALERYVQLLLRGLRPA